MTYDEWTATPAGAFALSLAVRAENFKEANTVLKVAFEAGQANPPPPKDSSK